MVQKNMSLEQFEKKSREQQTSEDTADFLELDDGTIEVDLTEPEGEYDPDPVNFYEEGSHYENLVDKIDTLVLDDLATAVIDGYNSDNSSRQGWMQTLEKGLDLLGIEVREQNQPFKGACSAHHTLLLESAVKFQSKASNEILPANGPVKTKVLGDVTQEKEDRAVRVKKHLNWQTTEQMTEFYPDSEKLLLHVPLIGSGFKKTMYDSQLGRPVSEIVPADQFVINNGASDLHRAERYTHIIYKTKNSIERDFASGFYVEPEHFGEPSQFQKTDFRAKTDQLQGFEETQDSEGYTLYEQHVDIFIEGIDEDINEDKLALPYIITVDHESEKVIGVRRNWRPGDKKFLKKVLFTHYEFVPSFGFYGYGFIHLLGNLQMSLTAALRSLVDSGQFANLQGGFKLKGVRIVDDGEPISPGEFKEIESHVQDINKALYPLPFKEPSTVLMQMLNFLDEKGQKFADSTEQVIADATNQGPVGTTMALLDASTKFFSAIHKRLHRSQKHELKVIAEINHETLPDDYVYNLEKETARVTRDDYNPETIDIVPVSDPNISSSAHRMTKAQTLLQIATQVPQQHDMREVLQRIYIDMDIGDVEKILPAPETAEKQEPMADIQTAIEGKPIKAFEGQEHQSHISLKQAFLSDPMSGGNPSMAKARTALEANIQEHLVLSFIEQSQAQVANSNGEMTLEQAAQQVAQMNQQKLEQQQQEAQNSQPEMIQAEASRKLAEAELMDKQNDAQKIQNEHGYKIAELIHKDNQLNLDAVKAQMDMEKLNIKIDADMQKLVKTKAFDAQIAALQGK